MSSLRLEVAGRVLEETTFENFIEISIVIGGILVIVIAFICYWRKRRPIQRVEF